MSNELLISELSDFIVGQILKQPGRKLSAGEALISSGLVDSFSLVDLALHIEDTYGVHIDDTELNAGSFDSLEQLAAMIQQRRG